MYSKLLIINYFYNLKTKWVFKYNYVIITTNKTMFTYYYFTINLK